MQRFPVLIALGILLTACDAGDEVPTVVRDSAGVTIVEYPAGVSPPTWSLSPEPVLAIGGLTGDPATELYRARHAVRIPDGGLAVANEGTQEVRFFDPAGRMRRTVGREGGGPGEYRQMWGMTRLPGDSLGVWDWTSKRLTVYDGQGDLGRTIPVPAAGGFSPRLLGLLDDRHIAVAGGIDPTALFVSGGGVSDDSTRVLIVSLDDGAVVDTLGPYPGRQQFTQIGEGSLWVQGLVFGREERIAVSPGVVHVGDDRRGEIRWRDPAGRLVRVLRIGPPPSAVTDEALALYRQRQLEGVEAADLQERRRRLNATPAAERFPAFDDLFADRLGRVWIREFDPSLGPERSWVVIGPNGQPAGRVRLGERSRPVDAGDGYVVLYARDDLDVESVLVFDLVPGTSASD